MVTVDKKGEITTLNKGSAVVTAADKRNQLHTGSAQVGCDKCLVRRVEHVVWWGRSHRSKKRGLLRTVKFRS